MGAGQRMMTDGEIEAYVRLAWLDQVSVPVICLKTGLTRGRVDGLVRRLGLPRRHRGPCGNFDEIKARIKELWPTGLSVRKIAVELGINANQVTGHVSRLNLESRGSPIKRRDGLPRQPQTTVPGAQRVKTAHEQTERIRAAAEAAVKHDARMRVAAIEARRVEAEAQLEAERAELVQMQRERVARLQGPRPVRCCQWLTGEPREQNFCTETAIVGKPYCLAHYERSRVVKTILQAERV